MEGRSDERGVTLVRDDLVESEVNVAYEFIIKGIRLLVQDEEENSLIFGVLREDHGLGQLLRRELEEVDQLLLNHI